MVEPEEPLSQGRLCRVVMIFVTLGNVPLPFNRLAAEIDRIAPELGEKVLVQSGHTKFSFTQAKAKPFLDSNSMQRALREASVVVAQGGWGTIAECLEMDKRIVAVPRQVGTEHNHPQEELVRALEKRGYLLGVYSIEKLHETIQAARTQEFQPLVRGDASGVINGYLEKTFSGEEA